MVIKYKHQKGFILITAIILLFVCSGIILSSFTNIEQEYRRVEIDILKSKAKYNAVSGFALERYDSLYIRDLSLCSDWDLGELESNIPDSMGWYDNISVCILKDSINGQLYRYGQSKGYANYVTFWNDTLTFVDSMDVSTGPVESLSHFMYLTGHEQAGGGPQSFNNSGRSPVTFGEKDNFAGSVDGKIQSNDQLVISNYGDCPEFLSTVTLSLDENNEPIEPNMGSSGCTIDDVFQGDPQFDTTAAICLPPPDFEEKKLFADYVFDATELLISSAGSYPGGMLRDTLIMTEIEFIESGGFNVTRYWYLMGPHLESGYFGLYPDGSHLDIAGCEGTTTWCSCSPATSVTQCNAYEQLLNRYHARTLVTGVEEYIDENMSFINASHHFDIHPYYRYDPAIFGAEFKPSSPNTTMISTANYLPNLPTAIYIKGGPVLVHGTYKGKYTIMTDEYITYRRHAYPVNNDSQTPLDTIMCNIWLVDDLVNADASSNGSMALMQPTEECMGGSDNVMGLVSGANVIIANTRANGARNNEYDNDININAHIIAFNESFTIQYWQNSTRLSNNPSLDDYYNYWGAWNTGWGSSSTYKADGNGLRYGSDTDSDYRGDINLWGGIVQIYRGYMKRNYPGPYNTTIGMDKQYNWDDNLRCNTPPLYPESLECGSDGPNDEYPNLKIKQFRIF